MPRESNHKLRSAKKLNGGPGRTPAQALVSATPLVHVDVSPHSQPPPIAEHTDTNRCFEVGDLSVGGSQPAAASSLAPPQEVALVRSKATLPEGPRTVRTFSARR